MGRLANQVVGTIAYSASAAVSKDLPVDRRITELHLFHKLQHDNTGATTPNADALLRYFSGIKVSGMGRTFYDVTDARLLHYLNVLRRKGAVRRDAFTATSTTNDLIDYASHFLHPGNDHKNPYDEFIFNPKTGLYHPVGIPTQGRSPHSLTITWAAATALGTNITIDTASATTIEVAGVQDKPLLPTLVPKMSEQDISIDATYSNLSKLVNLPVGSFLRSVLVMLTDNTAAPNDALDDTRISKVAIILPNDGNRRLVEIDWRVLTAKSRTYDVQFANTHVAGGTIAGVGLIDFTEIADPAHPLWTPWGLDTRGMSVGDIQLAFTIDTGNGNIKLLYDQMEWWQ